MEPIGLTDKSRAILEAIAQGHSYEQILAQDPAWTYHDIFRAAVEALDVARAKCGCRSYEERMEEIRQAYPRAYEKWSNEEDDRLRGLFRAGTPVKEIARALQRQPADPQPNHEVEPCRSTVARRGCVSSVFWFRSFCVSHDPPSRRYALHDGSASIAAHRYKYSISI